jgi:hypothetical protein
VRFERDVGEGFVRLFPETFSFRADRHDPAELYLQLDDLARKPQLLSPRANARDAQLLVSRLVVGAPRHLERLLERLEGEARLQEQAMTRVYEDVAILAQTLSRLVSESDVEERPGIRMASYQLRRLVFRCLFALVERRVTPSYRDAYAGGRVDPVDPADDLSETGFFYTLESGEQDAVDRSLMRLAERSFHRWLEDVCLDEDNRAFEVEGSPFEDRETEVLRAIVRKAGGKVLRAEDLSPFLRRPGNRDCLRVLRKLSAWFLRQYDIHHAAAMIHMAEDVAHGRVEGSRILSQHRTRNYLLAIIALVAPFVGAAFGYGRAPMFFDVLCACELVVVYVMVLWFLLYRFCWKRDLTFFHASVPRIAAGIIVGYLPILFIDEVWALANRPWTALAAVSLLLGFATLLYIYIEVQRRLRDTDLAFARARQIFLLGVLQSFGTGLVIMGLTGGFMASRNWSGGENLLSMAVLREVLPPLAGELPRIVGFEPFYTYPGAICLMTFLSFFIGTFLQLLWEDIPITEPL